MRSVRIRIREYSKRFNGSSRRLNELIGRSSTIGLCQMKNNLFSNIDIMNWYKVTVSDTRLKVDEDFEIRSNLEGIHIRFLEKYGKSKRFEISNVTLIKDSWRRFVLDMKDDFDIDVDDDFLD